MSEEKVLPPFVYGKLRGHLTVKVDEILWVKTNPGNIFVELLWWGEKESHIFKPVSINHPGNINEEDTSVTFNIRTSLLLFENYIKKSGKLIFGVFKYPSREHVGDVTVWNPFKTIFNDKIEQGYYPIFSKNRLRIGDLRISFELWMAKKDNLEAINETDKDRKKNSGKGPNSKNQGGSSSSSVKDIEDVEQADPLYEVLNRGKELRDAMTMSVLEDAPVDNIDKVIAYDSSDNIHPSKNSGSIDANKLMDFLMGKELNPDDEVLAIKTLRSVSPTQSVVNHELKSRLTSAQSCQCCFKNTNSCSSCTSRNLSSANSVNCSRPQTSNSGISNHRTATKNEEEMRKSKHVIELVNCYKLVIQCLHLNSLGAKKVKGVSSKSNEKVKKKPGLYYMIEHLPGSQSNVDKEKPWNLKQTRFVSRKINDNEIIFGESNYLIEAINSNFSWPKVLKQLNGTSLKIYWRYHNQRLPCYLGSVVLKDDSITPAGLFSTFTLPVNSNSGITVGHLSLLLELGHNRKTFGSHLLNCDLLKDTNKELGDRDENVSCDCNGCRTASGERYDAIWGREMERRARDMMVSCHHQCCQSACDKNPPTKSLLSNERHTESRVKSVLTESQKSSTVSPDDTESNRDMNRKEEILTNHTKFRLDDIPSNIPDSLKSDSSDSTSTKSDSVKNDLRLEAGNIRPRCLTTDASCQVTFDGSQKETRRENPDDTRLCKSCLSMSNYKPDPYSFNPNMNLYTTDVPNWSKMDRFYQPPMYVPLRERNHYQNHYQPFHSCHCCPSEVPSSHKCCYEMASAQLNAARHYGHDHYRVNEIHHDVPPPPMQHVAMPSEPCSNSSELMTIHELSISVDRIIDFPMFNRELNEDADCFVDYTFPVNKNNKVIIPHRRYSTEVSMISKEVSFSTVTKHTLTLPSSQNLNQVFTSIAFPSLDFNIWCRFYRSIPVDHVIAKAILPVGRICALKQEFEEAGGLKSVKDKVCLPLLTVASPLSVQYPTKVSGSMEVTLIYKNYNPEVSTQNRSSLNSNYRPNQDRHDYNPSNDYQRGTNSGTHSTKNSSSQCCNSIKYNTIQRTSSKNFTKTDVFNPDQVVNEPSTKPIRRPKERTTEDRALSPIQELSSANSSKDQIEELQKNLERLVVETHVHKGESSKYKSDYDESDTSINAYLKKCRDLVQLESSSDEGKNSIIPTVKPDMKRRKNKNRSATNQLIEFQKTNKDNSNSESLSSDNLPSRINDNFGSDINLSDDDTLKSVSSVNSDDSSSHVGFIAFNKDFVKNDCNMRKRKESQDIPAKMFPKVNSPPKKTSVTRCTQTAELVTNINQNPTSMVKIQSGSFFKAKIEVERAINLPLLAPYGSVNKLKPSSYVSLDAFVDGNSEHFASEIVYNSTDPEWNASWNVMLPTEYLYKCDKKLVLNVMLLSHAEDGPVRACMRKNEDRGRPADEALASNSASRYKLSHRPKGAVRKQALIDLTSLCAGLRLIFGWYSLINESTPCSGQIKIKITPLEDISRHKSAWFKEYMEWEKGRNRPSSNTTSSKLDEFKMTKLVENMDAKSSLRLPVIENNGAKTSTQKIPELKKTDSIDRDLVYISLNQKLSELDKIPESFKNKQLQSSESNQSTNLSSICNERKRKSSDASKDLSDLNIDKDISYVNKLLAEVPLFRASSGNAVGVSNYEATKMKDSEQPKVQSSLSSNFKNVSEVPGCSKDLKTSGAGYNFVAQTTSVQKYSENSSSLFKKSDNPSSSRHVVCFSENLIRNKKPDSTALKTPQDFLNTSFNASDILDLEETKEKTPNDERLNINSDSRDVNYNYGVDDNDKSKTESRSDESQFNKVSNSDKIQSQYLSFSPEEMDEDLVKSGSSILPSECVQACSGSESQSCVFNNKKTLRNYSHTGEFRRFSPGLSNESNCEIIRQNKYKSVRPDQSEILSDEEGHDVSKGIETLSGQSSICTDDQSMNYSEPLNAQTSTYQQNLPDNAQNLNSDLMEEASSEIDRILRELSKR